MRKAILRLLRTIRAISLESTNLPELAGTIPPPGRLPPPWISWTLLGLIYYLDRKLWAWETVCERLGPHVERDSEPKDPERIIDFLQQGEQGILPGFPDWSYWLNQNLIDLTHRGTGEQIHLDLLTEPKLTNIAQFVSFIKAFRVPNPIIGRLRTLSPSGAGIESALHVLHENDIIDIDCLRIITIPRKLFGAAGAIQQFLTKWEMPENRMPLAVRLGDWLEAAQQARGRDVSEITQLHANWSRASWCKVLQRKLNDWGPIPTVLAALAEVDAKNARELINEALRNKNRAHGMLENLVDDPTWCPRVFELLMRFKQPEGSTYFLPYEFAQYLGRHRYHLEEVMAWLLREKRPPYYVILPLAARCAPERLELFLGEALNSESSTDRLTASAMLVMLGHDWCQNLLMNHLAKLNSAETALECLAALERSENPTARECAQRWFNQHREALEQEPDSEDLFEYCIEGVRGALDRCVNELFDLIDKVELS